MKYKLLTKNKLERQSFSFPLPEEAAEEGLKEYIRSVMEENGGAILIYEKRKMIGYCIYVQEGTRYSITSFYIEPEYENTEDIIQKVKIELVNFIKERAFVPEKTINIENREWSRKIPWVFVLGIIMVVLYEIA